MKVHEIDIQKLAVLLLPTFMRKPVTVALLRALIAPLATLNGWRTERRRRRLFELAHTGQVWSIEHLLNSKYDPDERRIEVGDDLDDGWWQVAYSAEVASPAHIVLHKAASSDPGNPLVLCKRSTIRGRKSFTVLVPQEVHDRDEGSILAEVNACKLPGTTFKLKVKN